MTKDCLVQIKISQKDKDLIKKFGGSPTKIFWLGYKKWCEEIPEILREKAEYYQKLYLQCNDKLAECNDIVSTKKGVLDEISRKYLETNRPLEDISTLDRNWIQIQMEKHELPTSVEKFLENCRRLNGGP